MRNVSAGFLVLMLALSGWLAGCKPGSTTAAAPTPAPAQRIDLLFTYGSEKEDWIKIVTTDFNREHATTASGKIIQVKAIPMGSGECIDTLLSGQVQAHLTSPASAAFIKLGNAQSRVKTGKDLIGATENLVLSPVVIAMWKPMAEALDWGRNPIGWAEILGVAQDPKGWATFGHPEWGRFRFGHTSPLHSNSGLISLFAEVYAATGKTAGLAVADVNSPATARYLSAIENAVVHYGSSTGFFGKKLFALGPEYLSAAVLYENMVAESYSPKYHLPFPIVAIYPKEGTFWSDHPAGIVQREWVTPEHAEASQKYIAYLLEKPQQQRALESGFRPASLDVPLASPIDTAHGVNPKEPQTTLEVPSVDVMDAILRLWEQNKKRSSIVLVFDVCGSMKDNDKILYAREGSVELVRAMHDTDDFSLLPFHNALLANDKPTPLGPQRAQRQRQLESLFASGGTALYDAVLAAYRLQMSSNASDRITAIVVLSDGQDTASSIKLEELLANISSTQERETIRIFTIGYGKDADSSVLNQISEVTQAKYYEGKPENIREVFKDISTFF
jgi:Ca-activated chloride channel family protein